MTTRGIALLALGLTLTIGLPGAAQKWSHPRTASGDPDLEGVWTSYEVTIDDSRTFERPWTAVLDLEPQGAMYE